MSAGKRGRFWEEEEETTCCFITVWNWNGNCESKHCLEGKQSKISVDLGSCVCKPAAHISPTIPACFAQLRWTSGNYVRERWRRNVRGHFRKLSVNELWCVWWHFRKEMSVSTNRVDFPSDHLRICSSEHVLSKQNINRGRRIIMWVWHLEGASVKTSRWENSSPRCDASFVPAYKTQWKHKL